MATEPMPIEVKDVHYLNTVPGPVQVETHYRRSATMGKLVTALAKAQLEFDKVRKEAENEGFKRNGRASKYATLDAVINATRGPMARNELVILALPDSVGADGKLRLTSLLIHSSEEFIESTLTMAAVDKLTPQQVGTLLTYGRRYQWSSLTGVAPEDDDDGNQASGVGSKEAAQEVGKRKVAEIKARMAADSQVAPSTLFYIYPEKHNGHYAEFVNAKEFGAGLDDVAAEGLRQLFKRYISKNLTKTDTMIVPHEKMQELLEKLSGDCGIDVHELPANREPGQD